MYSYEGLLIAHAFSWRSEDSEGIDGRYKEYWTFILFVDLYKEVKTIREIKKIESVKETFRNYNIYYPKSQNIGETLLSTFKLIENLDITKEDVNEVPYVFKLANVTQYAYNKFNHLNQFHQGTISNVAVIDTNDVYVSLVM